MDSGTLSLTILGHLEGHYANQSRCTMATAMEIARHMLENGHGEREFLAALAAFRNSDAKWEYCPQWRSLQPYMPKAAAKVAEKSFFGLMLPFDQWGELARQYQAANYGRIADILVGLAQRYPEQAEHCDAMATRYADAEDRRQARLCFWREKLSVVPAAKPVPEGKGRTAKPIAAFIDLDDGSAIDAETGELIPF